MINIFNEIVQVIYLMVFGMKPKICDDYKDLVQIDNKENAIEYFSAKMKMDRKKLLELYQICLIHY